MLYHCSRPEILPYSYYSRPPSPHPLRGRVLYLGLLSVRVSILPINRIWVILLHKVGATLAWSSSNMVWIWSVNPELLFGNICLYNSKIIHQIRVISSHKFESAHGLILVKADNDLDLNWKSRNFVGVSFCVSRCLGQFNSF